MCARNRVVAVYTRTNHCPFTTESEFLKGREARKQSMTIKCMCVMIEPCIGLSLKRLSTHKGELESLELDIKI